MKDAWVPFSLNHYVRVKVMPVGVSRWNAYWLEFGNAPPALKPDEDGFVKMQLHEVANIFGGAMGGNPSPIETTIYLDMQAKTEQKATRCWPWSHQWSMWELRPDGLSQSRHCTGCGMTQRRALHEECDHKWKTISEGELTDDDEQFTGNYYVQQCEFCGKIEETRI